MANSEAVSGVRRQLLNRQMISAQRGIKEPTSPERYRRGKVSNSGANYKLLDLIQQQGWLKQRMQNL